MTRKKIESNIASARRDVIRARAARSHSKSALNNYAQVKTYDTHPQEDMD